MITSVTPVKIAGKQEGKLLYAFIDKLGHTAYQQWLSSNELTKELTKLNLA